ncbi:MAG: hypothetical protein PHV08_00210 [Sulfurovaceae bacterium]|nr:hypothetical protein [Sulfurovaceae bacterium]
MKKILFITVIFISVLNGKNIDITIGKIVVVPSSTYMCKTEEELTTLIRNFSANGLNFFDPLFVNSRCRLLVDGTKVKILDRSWSKIKILEPKFGTAYISREALED